MTQTDTMGAKPEDTSIPPMRGKSAKCKIERMDSFLAAVMPTKNSNHQTSARNFYLCHHF